MKLSKDIQELINARVISQETAHDIQTFYDQKKYNTSHSRLFIAFGILGATLVGLGIILILAHNWDEFSRSTKTILAFLPLIMGQTACIFALIKKPDSTAWKESSAAFLFFAVGSSISLISQIYNIPGNISSFLLTWILLCLPMVYLLKSSFTSLLCLLGITYYAAETNYFSYKGSGSFLYWPLLLAIFPHYYSLFQKSPSSNFLLFHNWIIPISITIALGTLTDEYAELMMLSYVSLFGAFILIGNHDFFKTKSLGFNGYRMIGSLGTVALLLISSFHDIWKELQLDPDSILDLLGSAEFISFIVLTFIAIGFLNINTQFKTKAIEIPELAFLMFIVVFTIAQFSSVAATVLINVLLLFIGVSKINQAISKDHLGLLNYGLLIIAALIVCRFFDVDMNFVVRGVLFIVVGVGFFLANYLMLKKRKGNG